MTFLPHLEILPAPQRKLWLELAGTPEHFTLYGGTALALRLGHRVSADFDFFSNQPFDPDALLDRIPYLAKAERVQVDANTLTCRVDRGGPALVSFFGHLGLGQAEASEQPQGLRLHVASLLDIAGTKVAVVQKRAQERDYLDVDALISHGIALPTALAAAGIVYGQSFNPLIALKALSYYDDVPALSRNVRDRLKAAVSAVDVARLPQLKPYRSRADANGDTS